MPTKSGRGRYPLAALRLALEAPVLSVTALGAALSRALLFLRRAVAAGARAARAIVAHLRSPSRGGHRRAPSVAGVDRRG
jgi:hypothetical protein